MPKVARSQKLTEVKWRLLGSWPGCWKGEVVVTSWGGGTLKDVVQPFRGVRVCPSGNPVQIPLQLACGPQQPHLELGHCHLLICMFHIF